MYHVTDRMLLIRGSYRIAEIIIGTIITSQLAGLSVSRIFQDFGRECATSTQNLPHLPKSDNCSPPNQGTKSGNQGDNRLISSNWKPLCYWRRKGKGSSLFHGYLPMLSAAVVGQIKILFFICQGIQSDQILTKRFEISIHGWILLYIPVVHSLLIVMPD